ncbi:PH domain-containing protein [Nocardioides piscis]|uniref:PH domain-containing protein n=1 Tax=Nocardioides piscis TaxID=2714938 RepID=A0A6G7YBK3_9ACTN|nr:PH domain-containing protein [Nocardioides piscis]QIK74173.1 PH domain-containing protein [Nocardioides piscis]
MIPAASQPSPDTHVDIPVALREPAHQVSPRAVPYWRVTALITASVVWIAALTTYALVPQRPWWSTLLLAVALLAPLAHVLVMPTLRFRIHRWEVTPTAIHTRAGWLTIENRVAPLSRVQTVDSTQGVLMRVFGLASLTVTTASAAGPITIDCLDHEDARRLVQELTEITGASEGDAT